MEQFNAVCKPKRKVFIEEINFTYLRNFLKGTSHEIKGNLGCMVLFFLCF